MSAQRADERGVAGASSERDLRIGMLARIAGLNPYSTGYSVWMDKLGEAEPIAETEAMRQGTELEEYVAKRFCERTGKARQAV